MLTNQRPEDFSLLFDTTPCGASDTVLLFSGSEVLLLSTPGDERLPTYQDILPFASGSALMHTFTLGSRRLFMGSAPDIPSLPKTLCFEPVRIFREFHCSEAAFLLNTAFHLWDWYGKHQYCSRCAGKVHPSIAERALQCDSCGLVIYPTISPAVIIAITDGDRILLARNARGVFQHFSLISGYVEVGETLEQAAHREIAEEVGIRVKNLRYMDSQPWGMSQSLMVGFHAQLDGSADVTLQESELAEARWFDRSELPLHSNPTSIAFTLIDRFRLGTL